MAKLAIIAGIWEKWSRKNVILTLNFPKTTRLHKYFRKNYETFVTSRDHILSEAPIGYNVQPFLTTDQSEHIAEW